MNHRFTTVTINEQTLYSGESLAEAIRTARGVKRPYVSVIDDNKLDMDNNGEVPWEQFSDGGEDFAIDVEFYLNHGSL